MSLGQGCRFNRRAQQQGSAMFGKKGGVQDGSGEAVGLGQLDFFAASAPDASNVADHSEMPTKKERRAKRRPQPDEDDSEVPAASGEAPVKPSTNDVATANALRRSLKIHTYGNDIPAPSQTADALCERFGLRPFIRRAVASAGYGDLTRVQMQALPALLSKRELLACAPTGSGKTAAYLIPLIAFLGKPARTGPRALVIVPTQELARQIHREALKLSRGAALNIGVLSKKLAAAAVASSDSGSTPFSKYDAIICTPLRLVGLLRKQAISLHRVGFAVLDEADKLLELGFLEQVDEVLAACTHSSVQRSLFSATLSPAVEELADTVLRQPVRVVVGERNAASAEVDQKLLFVGREDGKMVALRQLVNQGLAPPVLIFVQSKERAVELFHSLVYDGLRVDVMHADRSQTQRDAVIEQFRRGKVWVLIATELMARGIDFKGINLVINYDFPQSTTSYIHRIGRTGRAGRPGKAVTFFTESDVSQLRSIANVMRASGCEVAPWMLQLAPMRKDERRRLTTRPVARKKILKGGERGPRREEHSGGSAEKETSRGGAEAVEPARKKRKAEAAAPRNRGKAEAAAPVRKKRKAAAE